MSDLYQAILEKCRPLVAGEEDPEAIRRIAFLAGSRAGLPQAEIDRLAADLAARPAAARVPAGAAPPAPRLLIDWGLDLQANCDRTPVFHVLCPGLPGRPVVVAELDRRLLPRNRDWDKAPIPKYEDDGDWRFDEPLRLTLDVDVSGDCEYKLVIRAVFPQARQKPRCFSREVRFVVPDSRHQAERELKIDQADGSLLRLRASDLRDFTRISVRLSGNALADLQQMFSEPSAEPAVGQSESRHFVLQLPMKPDREMEEVAPSLRMLAPAAAAALRPDQSGFAPETGLPRHYAHSAMLVFGNRRTLLLAKDVVLLGRQRYENNEPVSDVVLRLYPLKQGRETVSARISRKHFSLQLEDDGLHVLDDDPPSTFGTFLDEQRISRAGTAIRPTQPARTHRIDLGGILSLDLSLHSDPTWAAWRECLGLHHPAQEATEEQARRECLELAEDVYCRIVGTRRSQERMWETGAKAGIDAVRLRRLRNLPLRKYEEHLRTKLKKPELVQAIHQFAAKNPTDHLSDREEYVLVYRSATLGTAASAAIPLASPTVAPIHARILHIDGSFWLEHLYEQRKTRVDGVSLAAHELVPLRPGMRLRFGEVEATFDNFEQLVLE